MFIGAGMDREAITAQLDGALLTDAGGWVGPGCGWALGGRVGCAGAGAGADSTKQCTSTLVQSVQSPLHQGAAWLTAVAAAGTLPDCCGASDSSCHQGTEQ